MRLLIPIAILLTACAGLAMLDSDDAEDRAAPLAPSTIQTLIAGASVDAQASHRRGGPVAGQIGRAVSNCRHDRPRASGDLANVVRRLVATAGKVPVIRALVLIRRLILPSVRSTHRHDG